MTLGNDHMALSKKLATTIGCASLVFTLPMLATANQGVEIVGATHFISSGRLVNVAADVTPDEQAQARAAIWALTQQAGGATCENAGTSDTSCFETFQTGSN